MSIGIPMNFVVLCPNGRRQSIRTTHNSSILQLLEEVCSRQSLNPDDFDICHYNKPLDLSLPIYFANLSNNALLELHPTKKLRGESLITVGLQVEAGDRYTKEFTSSATIWDVVEECLALKTDGSLAEEGDEPICIYMRQKVQGDALKTTTLRSLGLTEGGAIVRLIYRKPKTLENQAHISAPLSKSSFVEPKPSFVEPMTVSEAEDMLRPVSPSYEGCIRRKQPRIEVDTNNKKTIPDDTVNNVTFPLWKQNCDVNEKPSLTGNMTSVLPSASAERCAVPPIDTSQLNSLNVTEPFSNKLEKMSADESMDTENCHMDQDSTYEEIGAIHYIGERHAILYSLEDITDIKKADLPDEFFELTVDDVKYLMEEYKRNRTEMENQPLLTRDQRKRKILHNLAYYRQAVIRVYFPDKLVLQAVFNVDETVQVLSDFLRNFLEDKGLNFYLYITPPKEMLNPSKTLLEALLVPAAVVYFGCESQRPNYLMHDLRNKISDPRAASLAASESRKQSLSNVPLEVDLPSIETTSTDQNIEGNAVPSPSFHRNFDSTKPIPKWLKLSKK